MSVSKLIVLGTLVRAAMFETAQYDPIAARSSRDVTNKIGNREFHEATQVIGPAASKLLGVPHTGEGRREFGYVYC